MAGSTWSTPASGTCSIDARGGYHGEPVTNLTPTTTEPLRSQVRQAIERAWARAVESGALQGAPDGVDRPRVEVERPAKPEHGDLATNLALKLARPLRRPPDA